MRDALRRSAAHVIVDDVASPHLSPEDDHHLTRVLRLRDGESVTCTDGLGSWVEATWAHGELVLAGDVHYEPPPEPRLTLAVVPLKGDRTDLVIEKAVEIGIDRLVVLSPSERSVVRWVPAKVPTVLERHARIVRSAVMQSRRVHLPELVGPVSLDAMTTRGTALAEPGGTAAIDDVTTIVVGPEGGFTATELAGAGALIDLGPAVLRAETAAMVAATRLVAHWRR